VDAGDDPVLDGLDWTDEEAWMWKLLPVVAILRFRVCCPARETLSVQIALNPSKSKRN